MPKRDYPSTGTEIENWLSDKEMRDLPIAEQRKLVAKRRRAKGKKAFRNSSPNLSAIRKAGGIPDYEIKRAEKANR